LNEFKPAAKELAELLSTPDGLRTLRLMAYTTTPQQIDTDEVFHRIASDPLPALEESRNIRVGIWEQQAPGENPAFARKRNIEPVELWSEEETIPARTAGRKRVVLLGESVARGFFHDPWFSPAMALRRMLSWSLGEEVEVIDLARTDILMLPLLRLVRSALLLKPDAIVVFAGNNWHPTWSFRNGRLTDVGIHLRRHRDWMVLKDVADEALSRHVRLFTETLGSILGASGVPLVFMIPEFNLNDWRDVSTAPPLLPGDETARWLDTRAEAEYALERKDLERATALSQKMLQIDRGSAPAGYYLLADASSAAGDLVAARRYLRMSREVSLYWPRGFSPSIYASVRRSLLDSADQCGFVPVDLQRYLERDYPDELPGRRLFHDYCHLTVEGTCISLAHGAEALLPLLGGERRSWEQLASVELRVPPDVVAGSHLLAAAFNANCMQPRDVVRHHLEEAVRVSPTGARLISLFADFHVRRTPALLCASLEELLNTLRLTSFHLLYGYGRRPEDKVLNLGLIRECKRALASADAGFEERIDRLLLAEHGVAASDVDLLDTAYAPDAYSRQLYRGQLGFYRAFDPVSTFHLICRQPCAVELQLTYRAGNGASGGEIGVAVNGVPLTVLAGSANWRSESVRIPERELRQGVNDITIAWPAPDWDREKWIDETAGLLEANIPIEISPVFGHLHWFKARADLPGAGGRESSLPETASSMSVF